MVQDFFNNLDWMLLLRAFLVGGAICVIGQILIDKTKLTPARILVTFVTVGAILGGLGIYQKLVDFAGCGATAVSYTHLDVYKRQIFASNCDIQII